MKLAATENGGDPFSLQRVLGHTDQKTTSKYVNMALSNVKAQHTKYSLGNDWGEIYPYWRKVMK